MVGAVLRILAAAGLPAEIDLQTAVTTYGGQPRQLWMTRDRTRVELPVTRMRVSLRPRPGVISITGPGAVRVSDGERRDLERAPEDASRFGTAGFANAGERSAKWVVS